MVHDDGAKVMPCAGGSGKVANLTGMPGAPLASAFGTRYTSAAWVATNRSPLGRAASSRAEITAATASIVNPEGTVSAGVDGRLVCGAFVECTAPLQAGPGPA